MAAISNTNNIVAPFGNDRSFNRSNFLFALFGYEVLFQISLKRQIGFKLYIISVSRNMQLFTVVSLRSER
jgi:hypothetical protein